jgi:pyruvate/2-oxoglutarate dehydrogenase complex dihydrolipoamide acyltransferase (E2) component
MRGLIEVDVTKPRRRLRALKARTGETLSFTAFVIYCLGQAVDTNRHMHACRNLWNRLILFDEVDVIMPLEIEFDGLKFLLTHIIRAVNRRTLRDIHDEIRAIQARPARSPQMTFVKRFLLLPAFLRRLFLRIISKSPHLQKRYAGTVGLTTVGMFGTGGGWGFGLPAHTLAIALGGIGEKPGVINGRIEIREYLSVTLGFDHDIIDGAPAARFTQRFKELIESGCGLDSLS